MLKRQHFLINEWLLEHLKQCADKYDLSLSEVVRLKLCIETVEAVNILYPQYKPSISLRKILKLWSCGAKELQDSADIHQLISQIYFEARKAIEFADKKMKKKDN